MIVDQLNQSWTNALAFLNGIIVPDWGGLVSLLPIFLIIGVVGPILTLLAFFWFAYIVQKPRLRTAYVDHRRHAALDADGKPVFPPGEPYSPREQVIYPAGSTRAEGGEELVLACPKCGLVRSAAVDHCGNCGLSFTMRPSTIAVRPVEPPPGGAAAA